MKKNLLTLLIVIAVAVSACQKDNTPAPVDTSSPYQPFTASSKWAYRNATTIPGQPNPGLDTTINTMTAATISSNGITYHKSTAVTGTETVDNYFGVKDHVYYNRSVEDNLELIMPYLNDSQAVNESFVTTLQIPGTDAQIRTTTLEKGISKQVLGKTYQDVIHSRTEYQTKINGVFKTGVTQDFYVAKNIGIISISATLNNKELVRSELISASIK